MTLDYRSNGNGYPDPIDKGFDQTCYMCDETYETDTSDAEDYEKFCSYQCEHEENQESE